MEFEKLRCFCIWVYIMHIFVPDVLHQMEQFPSDNDALLNQKVLWLEPVGVFAHY